MIKKIFFVILAFGSIVNSALPFELSEREQVEYLSYYKRTYWLFWEIEYKHPLPKEPTIDNNRNCEDTESFDLYVSQVEAIRQKRQGEYLQKLSQFSLLSLKEYIKEEAINDNKQIDKRIQWARKAYDENIQICLKNRKQDCLFKKLMQEFHENNY